jgi:mRNA interferase RelE/StbE
LKVEFKNSFEKDLRKIEGKKLKAQVKNLIESIEQENDLHEISNLKKLRGGENYFRIKIGDYRIGLIIEQDTIIFVRFLHRKDIYRYFP